jgi:hypothetical protein
MALLATLQDSDVLPPEGTPEANRIVKSVIQCQSLFMKSSDPSIRAFFDRALQSKLNVHAAEASRRFREEGWTSETLEALSESYVALSDGQRTQLAEGFRAYNLIPGDFQQLSELFLRARTVLSNEDRIFINLCTSTTRNAGPAISSQSGTTDLTLMKGAARWRRRPIS